MRTFRSEDAKAMWAPFRQIRKSFDPRSTSYDFMQEPLLEGEVRVAFGRTALVTGVLIESPEPLVTFPAPGGPLRRGFIPVVVALAGPKETPERDASARLIEYPTLPSV